ncbi:unnamed protein product [Tuber aestivum]|uniref:PX domain-containing protein n=1 Tax=Tuber aestivum TaxID=59557 RepID=A0A292PWP7_9PEZI|nr:unnamed protein product [Tuber aestivum]
MTALEISIPTTSLATSPGKPHTVYHILLRLPLRSITVKKRYNDFVELHSRLTDIVGSVPPKPLPPKSYFSRTVNNPVMTEERRDGLEKYLLGILRSDDPRWRDSPAWRTFLNLPANWSAGSSAASSTSSLGYMLGGGIAGGGGPITDPTLWLDTHRELKTLLHDARMYLSKRDQARSAGEQHEASAGAKRCLVKVGSLITALDSGLKELGGSGRGNNGWGAGKEGKELLDGEIRRRKDLVSSARKERDGLESLANSLASKRAAQSSSAAAAMAADKNALFAGTSASRNTFGGGRVLGAPLPETEHTRELDNQGVLQLNDQYMREQDRAVEGMLKNVGRMKEIGAAIGEEIDLQNKMLEDLDHDVDKVGKKMKIAKKRVNKIS